MDGRICQQYKINLVVHTGRQVGRNIALLDGGLVEDKGKDGGELLEGVPS